MENKFKFTANAVKWFDKVNGNTYHSVRITRHSDGEVLYCPWQYGYGEQYRSTALDAMLNAGWLPESCCAKTIWRYERENNYPILWNAIDGLKRDMIANGKK